MDPNSAAGRTRRPSRGQRAALIVLGIVIPLVLLEVGLRVGGAVWTRSQDRENTARLADTEAVRVLCLGESTTAYGYPEVLERVLNEPETGRRHRVFNEGVAGTTTDEILARVPGLLERYDPDVVVAMMGINDPKEAPRASFLGTIAAPLESLRVYELYALIVRHLRDRSAGLGEGPSGGEDATSSAVRKLLDRAKAARAAGRLDEASNLVRRATASAPGSFESWRTRIIVEGAQGAPRDALLRPPEAHFLPRLEKDPTDLEARLALARLYLDVRADDRAATLLRAAPPPAQDHPRWRRLLAAAHEFPARRAAQQGAWDEAVEHLAAGLAVLPPGATLIRAEFHDRLARGEAARGNDEDAARHTARARDLRAQLDDSFTAEQYRRLHDAVRAHGTRLVAAQYPRRGIDEVRAMLDGADDVVFVDNGPSFDRAVDRLGFWMVFDDEFAGDFGHMSERGKALLAENVAAGVRRAISDGRTPP